MVEVPAAPSYPFRPTPLRVAIVAALPAEVRPFLRLVQARRRRDPGCRTWDFGVGEGRGILALSGMGCQAAHLAAGRLLTYLRPQVLLSIGFGGALSPELSPGTVVLGQAFWHYYPHGPLLTTVPASEPPQPLGFLVRLLEKGGLRACTGDFVTSASIIHKGRQGALPGRLRRPVLDLETSALAEAAARRELPFIAIRVITDGSREEIPNFLARHLEKELTVSPLTAIRWLAADPRRAAPLFRLWQRSRQAAAHLARALALLLPALKESV